jgi:hypothetical protein
MRIKLLFVVSPLLYSISYAQPTTFSPRGIGGGGALFFPTINPANDNEYYVACDMSELFHSTDYGLNYSQVGFQKLQVSGVSTYEFTNDANVAYCSFNDGNQIYPVKTIDGGATWNQVNGYNIGTYGDVYCVKSNYSNPLQLLINAYGDILFTNNGGTSFSLVRHAANNGVGLIMGGVFWDGANIYIGTNEGIVYSTNGGTSWSLMTTTGITAGQVIWSFAGAKVGSATRFVCITAASADVYNGVMPYDYYNFPKGVYVMNNANTTWLPKSTGINFSTDFVMYCGMAWNDTATIYLGGSDSNTGGPLVHKTSNGGTSWSKVFNTTNNANIVTGWEGYLGDKNWSWSEACFGMSVAPYNSQKAMFGSFSSVHLTSNGGTNWRQAYVASTDAHPQGSNTPQHMSYHSIGLENTTCWQVYWQDANKMMGCFSDIGGIRSTDAGVTWGFQYTGFAVNSLYRMAKGSNGNMYGGCSNIHDMYQSTRLQDAQLDASDGNGKIVYSTDNGATWTSLHTFSHPVYWVATDPSNANTMYASVIHFGGIQGSQLGGIYKTTDLNNLAGSTWTKLPNPPRTEGHPSNIIVLNDGKVVCTFSGRRNSSGVFTASSGCFIYDGASWTDVSNAEMDYWTKDIVLDPTDNLQNTWYVCVYSGWGGAPNGLGGLYKTTNRGASWVKLTGSQFDRVESITFNPQNNNQAYLTTETQGLWISSDMNNATPSWSLVTSYPFRQPERVFFNPYNQNEIWVSSFGNGMKVGSLSSTGIVDFSTGKEEFSIYPNPAHNSFSISVNCEIRLYDSIGREVMAKNNVEAGTSINISEFASGLYFIKVLSGKSVFTQKLLIE